jgi:hypothetical protein
MPTSGGPNYNRSGLVFSIDPLDVQNSVPAIGCGAFVGAPAIECQISKIQVPFINSVTLTNKFSFYTAAGISYPEGNYGGDLAGRNGLYVGYDVRGGSNVYGASRSLNMWVWDNDTMSWVEGYFNGARVGGHCYDNYGGAENGWSNEMAKFSADYNRVRRVFPNSTFILVGSHACQCFRQEDIDIMVSLGAPSSVIKSWTDNSTWREFVLVGKPGLGDGNAYGWSYENYPTNSSQVAHMNFGLPIISTGALTFDGSNDYLRMTRSRNPLVSLQDDYTLLGWCNQFSGPPSPHGTIFCTEENYRSGAKLLSYYHGDSGFWIANEDGSNDYIIYGPNLQNAGWKMMAATRTTSGVMQLYIDGELYATRYDGPTGQTYMGGSDPLIGAEYHSTNGGYYGEIGLMQAYNRALSGPEILNIFNQTKQNYYNNYT